MPIIAAQVHTGPDTKRPWVIASIRSGAGLPEYNRKERSAGFEVISGREGEFLVVWHNEGTDDPDDQVVKLREIAAYLVQHYWVKLDDGHSFGRYVRRPRLHVLYQLSWLGH